MTIGQSNGDNNPIKVPSSVYQVDTEAIHCIIWFLSLLELCL